MIGPFFLGSHCTLWWIWSILSVHSTIGGHCGWHLPFISNPENHDFHHSNGWGNFGTVGIMDAFFGTNKPFLNAWQSQVDQKYSDDEYPVDKILAYNGDLARGVVLEDKKHPRRCLTDDIHALKKRNDNGKEQFLACRKVDENCVPMFSEPIVGGGAGDSNIIHGNNPQRSRLFGGGLRACRTGKLLVGGGPAYGGMVSSFSMTPQEVDKQLREIGDDEEGFDCMSETMAPAASAMKDGVQEVGNNREDVE